ncbi:MAG TPA: ArsC/Spx/MgsR family protein [Candidatus Omnitrophota bacterium]|jgi:arsenate reductase|nr:ArsC/Spx/MgsR family protein [Candidatus Omnitrophota bacterium]
MEKITIYQKPSCSACKEVCQVLKDAGAEIESVDYYVTRIPKAKLCELARKMGVPLRELLRTKEQIYEDLRLGEKNLTDAQYLDLIEIYPDLLQRPIVEQGDRAILARPVRKIREFLASAVSSANGQAPAASVTEGQSPAADETTGTTDSLGQP